MAQLSEPTARDPQAAHARRAQSVLDTGQKSLNSAPGKNISASTPLNPTTLGAEKIPEDCSFTHHDKARGPLGFERQADGAAAEGKNSHSSPPSSHSKPSLIKQFSRMIKDRPRSNSVSSSPMDSPPTSARSSSSRDKLPNLKALVSPRGRGVKSKESSEADSGRVSDTSLRSISSEASGEHDRWLLDDHRKVLRFGTIEELFGAFIRNPIDKETIAHLVWAHRQFFTSGELMNQLKLAVLRTNDESFQKKLLNVLKHWIAINSASIRDDAEAVGHLKALVDGVEHVSNSVPKYLHAIPGLHALILAELVQEREVAEEPTAPQGKLWRFNVMESSAEDFAHQLCLIDQENISTVSRVTIEELSRARWTKDQAPGLKQIAQFANALSRILTIQIITPAANKDRIPVFSHVVAIGKVDFRRTFETEDSRGQELMNCCNFNSLLSVFLALQSNEVSKTFDVIKEELSKKTLKDYRDLTELMDPHRNFIVYRNVLRASSSELFIPCIEVHLKDLLYTTEGNMDWHNEEKKEYNFCKLDDMGKIIACIMHPRFHQYKFYANDFLLASLRHLRYADNDELSSEIDALSSRVNSPRKRALSETVGDMEFPLMDPRTSLLHMPPDEREALVIEMYDDLMRFHAQLVEKEKEIYEVLGSQHNEAQRALLNPSSIHHNISKDKRTKSTKVIANGVLVLPKLEK